MSTLAVPRLAMLRARARHDARALAWPLFRLLAIEAALVVVVGHALGFRFEAHDLPTVVVVWLMLVAMAAGLQREAWPRLANAIEGVMLLVGSSLMAMALTMVLAPAGPAYADPLLDRIDQLIMPGVTWLDMFHWLQPRPRLVTAMGAIYRSLTWQPFVLVIALAMIGRADAARRFLHAWMLALIICIAIFTLVPAMSAQVYYGLDPADMPAMSAHVGWRQYALLEQLRSGALRVVSIDAMTGLITFPSFHTAGAVLLAWGFWSVTYAGRAFLMLDIAMVLTVPLLGGHYFVDVLGGLVVAAIAIRATRQ